MSTTNIAATATSLLVKATALAVHWAGMTRKRALSSIVSMPVDEKDN